MNIKLWLCLIALVFGAAGMIVGAGYGHWGTTRRAEQECEEKIDSVSLGLGTAYVAATRANVARTHKDMSCKEFSEELKGSLVGEMMSLWRYEGSVNDAGFEGAEAGSLRIGSRILEVLGCDSTAEFFEVARKLFNDDFADHFPELYDTESEDHKSFRSFVSRSFGVESGW